MLNVDKKLFDEMCIRRDRYINDGLPGLDPLMVPIIKELQCIPDIVSLWSCQGHTVKEMNQRARDNPLYRENTTSAPYVSFAVRRDGLKTILEIYNEMIRLSDDIFICRVNVSQLHSIFDKRFGKHYTAVSISCELPVKPKTIKKFNKLLLEAIIAVKREKGHGNRTSD